MITKTAAFMLTKSILWCKYLITISMQETGIALSATAWFTIKRNVCWFQGTKTFQLGGSLQSFWTNIILPLNTLLINFNRKKQKEIKIIAGFHLNCNTQYPCGQAGSWPSVESLWWTLWQLWSFQARFVTYSDGIRLNPAGLSPSSESKPTAVVCLSEVVD